MNHRNWHNIGPSYIKYTLRLAIFAMVQERVQSLEPTSHTRDSPTD